MLSTARLPLNRDIVPHIFEQSPDPYWIIDPESSAFLHANRASEEQLGYSLDELLALQIGVIDVNLVLSTQEKWKEATAAIKPGETFRYLADLRCKSGNSIRVEITLSRLALSDRELFFAVTRDVSHVAAIEQQLRHRDQLLHRVMQTMSEGVLVLGPDDTTAFSNPKMAALVGAPCPPGCCAEWLDWFGKLGLVQEASADDAPLALAAIISSRLPVQDLIFRGQAADGQALWIMVNSATFAASPSEGFILTCTDVSEVRRSQARAEHLARTDLLTGLPNRWHFLLEVESRAAALPTRAMGMAILVINLDRFELLNETYGHSAGDELLIRLVERLQPVLPETGFLARVSADEFAVVVHLEQAAGEAMAAFAEGLAERILQAIRHPFASTRKPIQTCASLGLVVIDRHTARPELMLQQASIALAFAKSAGGDCWRRFHPPMAEQPTSRFHIESALREALANREFELFFQPKVHLMTGDLLGAEALIRWNRKEGKPISPAEFIKVAEHSNLIVAIGDFVTREACRRMEELHRLGLMDRLGKVAVNVSSRQFQQPGFNEHLENIVAQHGVSPGWLCIELTETALAADASVVRTALARLRERGFSISIDDFGSGYSSFSYLQDFVIDELKIDKSFIDEIDRSPKGMAIVSAMLAMARALGISVVAEGIEGERQLRLLTDHQCDGGQGYFFARPMPFRELVDWLRDPS